MASLTINDGETELITATSRRDDVGNHIELERKKTSCDPIGFHLMTTDFWPPSSGRNNP